MNLNKYGITIGMLLGTAIAAKLIDARPSEVLQQPLEGISTTLSGWTAERDSPLRDDILASLAATNYLSRTYRRGNDDLSLFVAYYANQRAGESMHSPKHCMPGAGWEIVNYGAVDLRNGPEVFRVNRHTIQKDGSRMAVLYWYQSKRRVIADEYLAKMFLVRDAVVERRTGGAIVRIICREDPATVKAALEFSSAILPEIRRCMTGETVRIENR